MRNILTKKIANNIQNSLRLNRLKIKCKHIKYLSGRYEKSLLHYVEKTANAKMC